MNSNLVGIQFSNVIEHDDKFNSLNYTYSNEQFLAMSTVNVESISINKVVNGKDFFMFKYY